MGSCFTHPESGEEARPLGHGNRSPMPDRPADGSVGLHAWGRIRSAKGADRQHSLFAWMQLWIIFFRAVWFHALKKSACIV